MTFRELGIPEAFDATLARMGLVLPTPIQTQAIPLLLAGGDLIAGAPTGTGKTAAFLLPALVRMLKPASVRARGPRVLVLTPTRELAQQVNRAAFELSRDLPRVKSVCITGGESYVNQNRLLSSPHEILVATPGRLMDQMQSGRVDFSRLEVLVLDEADRMLDMGFSDDVLAIARALPAERQTVCFTATISQSVHDLSRQLQRDPQRISVSAPPEQKVAIDQSVVFVDDIAHKRRLLGHWLTDAATVQAIVFTATKRDAESLAELLDADGHSTVALHGDLPQRARTRMLNQLRRGEARVLVATDVAARGLDVPTVTHVFNFDLPRMAEDYVHRIGRTGRAGASGVAVSFVGRQDLMVLRRIERFLGNPVRVNAVVGLEARFNPAERSSRPRPDGKPGSSRFGKPGGAPFKRNGSPDGAKRFGGEAGRSFAGPRPEGNRGERSFGGPRPDGNRGGERSSWRRDGAGNGAETPWRHGEADGNRGERRRPEADGNRARPGETHARRDGGWEKRGASPAGVKRRDRDDY